MDQCDTNWSSLSCQGEMSKLKCHMHVDQEAGELENVVRAGMCKLVSAAFEGYHLVLIQQETGQAEYILWLCRTE